MCAPDSRWKLPLTFIPVRSSPEKSTASGVAMEWVSIFQAMKFRNFTHRLPMFRKANTP